jgi:hypothetical protein
MGCLAINSAELELMSMAVRFPRSDSIAAGGCLCYTFFAQGRSYETRNSSRIQSCDDHLRLRPSGRDALNHGQYSRGNLLQLPPFLYRQTKIAGLSRSRRQVQEKVRPEEHASGGLRENWFRLVSLCERAKGGSAPFALFLLSSLREPQC